MQPWAWYGNTQRYPTYRLMPNNFAHFVCAHTHFFKPNVPKLTSYSGITFFTNVQIKWLKPPSKLWWEIQLPPNIFEESRKHALLVRLTPNSNWCWLLSPTYHIASCRCSPVSSLQLLTFGHSPPTSSQYPKQSYHHYVREQTFAKSLGSM